MSYKTDENIQNIADMVDMWGSHLNNLSELKDLNITACKFKEQFDWLSAHYDLIVGKPIDDCAKVLDGIKEELGAIQDVSSSIGELIPTIEHIDEKLSDMAILIPTIENIDSSLVRIAGALECIALRKCSCNNDGK